MPTHVDSESMDDDQITSIQSRFPTAYTIIIALIGFVAILIWFIPSGAYDRVLSEAPGKEVPVPGTYHPVDANPQGIIDLQMAPIGGFYDPGSYTANAIDISLFVLIIGGFLGVVNRTEAINIGGGAETGTQRTPG